MTMAKRIILLLILLLGLLRTADANDIRVLILDERFPLLPDDGESIKRIGSITGELLVSGVRYRGEIEVWKGKRGLYIINELPLEEYVKSVVLAEVAEGWEMEALKAQAVIVRTYAVEHMQRGGGRLYDLTSSTLHQLYRGDNFDARVAYAVMQTEGEILTYDGRPIKAFYHSTSGGRTELPEEVFGRSYPYLKSVTSDCSLSPYSVWQRRFSRGEIEKALGIRGLKDIRIKSYTKTGRVKELALITAEGTTVIPSKDFRRLLGWKALPSTWFALSRSDGSFFFDGRGYGHGVGLCQWGAQKMAKDGRSYREILSYYYPGTTIRLHEDRQP